MKNFSRGDYYFDLSCSAILLFLGALVLYPIYFILIASISDPGMVVTGKVIILPKMLNFEAYRNLWGDRRVWIGYRNSLLYTVAGTSINLLVTIPAGYAVSRRRLAGRPIIMLFFVFTMYFSGGLIPTFMVIYNLGIINTPWAILLPSALSVFNFIIVKSFFENTIPDALFEAAYMDGCDHFRFFIRIALPLSPALIAVMVLYYALARWNSYFEAMLYISDEKIQTLQVLIKNITTGISTATSETMTTEQISELMRTKELIKYAIVIVASVPLLILYPFIQKYFIQGVMIGAVKG